MIYKNDSLYISQFKIREAKYNVSATMQGQSKEKQTTL